MTSSFLQVSVQGEDQDSQYLPSQSSPVRQNMQTLGLSSSSEAGQSISKTEIGVVIKTEPGLDTSVTSSPMPKIGSSDKSKLSNGVYIEPIAPVCLKTQRKAFRSPMTIRSFFKPSITASTKSISKESEDLAHSQKVQNGEENMEGKSVSLRSNESNIKNDRNSITEKILPIRSLINDETTDKAKFCVIISEIYTIGRVTESHYTSRELPTFLNDKTFDIKECMASRGVLETENRLVAILESNKDESKMSERDCKYKVVINCDGCIKCDSINRNQPQIDKVVETKRKASNSPVSAPLAKRHKQSSIMNSFAKINSFAKAATKKQESETEEKSCPICQEKFEIGTSNEKINNHIDNCLIE